MLFILCSCFIYSSPKDLYVDPALVVTDTRQHLAHSHMHLPAGDVHVRMGCLSRAAL